MIPQEGKVVLLDFQRGSTLLDGCFWALFTNVFTITDTTILSDLVEATWPGYARQLAGPWTPAAIGVDTKAHTQPVTTPGFVNASGSPVTFEGWYLINGAGTRIVAAADLTTQTIPSGLTFFLSADLTDDQQ